MKQPVLEKDLLVKTHDVAPDCGTNALLPQDYFPALKKQFKGRYKVKVQQSRHGDFREFYGKIKIGNWTFFYQSDGLDSGNEYALFKKGTPKDLVDKSIAVLVREISKEEKSYLEEYGSKDMKPQELKKQLESTKKKLEESEHVLSGKTSYWNSALKDYAPQERSFSETIFDRLMVKLNGDSLAREKIPQNPPVSYAVGKYFGWKHRKSEGSIFVKPTFEEEMQKDLEISQTKGPNIFDLLRRDRKHSKKELKRIEEEEKQLKKLIEENISYAKEVIESPKMMQQVISLGEQFYPEYEGKRKQLLQVTAKVDSHFLEHRE